MKQMSRLAFRFVQLSTIPDRFLRHGKLLVLLLEYCVLVTADEVEEGNMATRRHS